MVSKIKVTIVGISLSICMSISYVGADTIQLVNGDTVSGKVVSLDFNQVKLETELLGNLVIARDRDRVDSLVRAIQYAPHERRDVFFVEAFVAGTRDLPAVADRVGSRVGVGAATRDRWWFATATATGR